MRGLDVTRRHTFSEAAVIDQLVDNDRGLRLPGQFPDNITHILFDSPEQKTQGRCSRLI